MNESTKVVMPGLTGLINIGNTCYINSAVQCLSHLPPIRSYFSSVFKMMTKSEKPDSFILIPFQELIQDLWDGHENIRPENFVVSSYMLSKDYRLNFQQDAQEFLRKLLDSLDIGIKSVIPGPNTIITDTFQGKIETKIVCEACSTETVKMEDFLDIPLSLPDRKELKNLHQKSTMMMCEEDQLKYKKKSDKFWTKFKEFCKKGSTIIVSLYDCIINHFKSQEIKDLGNLYFCETCQKKCPIEMRYKIAEFPNILVFSVKRFKYSNGSSKIGIHVQLPTKINLKEFGISDEDAEYTLIGLIQHNGGTGAGHYKAYCKNEEDSKWYNFNDKTVSECSIEEVLEAQAYIAFYQKSFMTRPKLKKCEDDDRIYIPLKWLNNYEVLANPKKIDFRTLSCKHGNLSPFLKDSSLFPINKAQFQALEHEFGVEGYPFTSIDTCSICIKETADIKQKIISEVKIAKRYKDEPEYEGPWYIVSSVWAQKWINFTNYVPRYSLSPEMPGIIDNSNLYENGELKKNLEFKKDYRAFNKFLWREFYKIYDCTQIILKKQKDIYSEDAHEDTEVQIDTEISTQNSMKAFINNVI